MARHDRDLAKEQFWRGVLQLRQQSNKTVGAFCTEHNLSAPSFYAWRRIIAERDRQASSGRPHSARTNDGPAFVPLTVIGPAPANPVLEVVTASAHIVRVPPNFDP